MPKKVHNKAELLANVLEKRDKEAKNKDLHMKYEQPANMWGEMASMLCNKSG